MLAHDGLSDGNQLRVGVVEFERTGIVENPIHHQAPGSCTGQDQLPGEDYLGYFQ